MFNTLIKNRLPDKEERKKIDPWKVHLRFKLRRRRQPPPIIEDN